MGRYKQKFMAGGEDKKKNCTSVTAISYDPKDQDALRDII